MYIEGKDRFLKDLDWVSIVKSIRELKAMMRVLLNDHQMQMITFERDSMLPSSKILELKEHETLEWKVPFENESKLEEDSYRQEIDMFISNYSKTSLSIIDINIMDELNGEKEHTQFPMDTEITNNDRLIVTDI